MQTIYVYGAKRDCSICVPAPSSEETASWLEAALQRKYRDQVRVQYIDYTHPLTEQDRRWAREIVEQERWVPLVVMDDEIIAEGEPRLTQIESKLAEKGIMPSTK